MTLLPSLLLCVVFAADAPIDADVVIRGATLYDGSAKPGVVGDLAIKGERIVAVGKFTVAGKPRVIDGKGLIVAPGFIDLHTHSDTASDTAQDQGQSLLSLPGRDDRRYRQLRLRAGRCRRRTSEAGEEHASAATSFIKCRTTTSAERVMKNANRLPTAEELKKMEDLVDKGMSDGAWGLSTGLIYNPGTYAKTDEIIALAKVAAKHGGFYASHIRDEGSRRAGGDR